MNHIKLKRSCWLFALLLFVLFTPSRHVVAQAPQGKFPAIKECHVGVDDRFKANLWTPVYVTVIGGKDPDTVSIRVTVSDEDGESLVTETPQNKMIQLAAGEEKTTVLYTMLGAGSSVRLALFSTTYGKIGEDIVMQNSDPTKIGTLSPPLFFNSILTVVFGKGDFGIEEAIKGYTTKINSKNRMMTSGESGYSIARVKTIAALPTQWQGYEAVDTFVMLADGSESFLTFTNSQARAGALKKWIRQGGRLVLFCGRAAPELMASAGPLADFAPGDFSEIITGPYASQIESYTKADSRIASAEEDWEISIPVFSNVQGQGELFAIANNEATPMIIRHKYGFGEIVYVGLDLNHPQLSSWKGLPSLLQKVLFSPSQLEAAAEMARDTESNNYYYGYETLDGQIQGTLQNDFLGITMIPFSVIALLIIFYIILIGPFDYWLVTKYFKRPELTWITFPTMVVVVSVSAYFAANYFKGDQLRVNQLQIVDFDLESDEVRGTAWNHLFTPRSDYWTVTFNPQLPKGDTMSQENGMLFSWLGYNESYYGYRQDRSSTGSAMADFFSTPTKYRANYGVMSDVPINVRSTKSFVSRWQAKHRPAVNASFTLQDEGEALAGEFTNSLGVSLENAIILFGGWGYYLGSIPDGETKKISDQTSRLSSRSLLKSNFDERDSRFNTMMFYEINSSKKENNYMLSSPQISLDLTPVLRQGYGVLLARVKSASSQLVRFEKNGVKVPLATDQDQIWTYYRFVIPLTSAATDRTE